MRPRVLLVALFACAAVTSPALAGPPCPVDIKLVTPLGPTKTAASVRAEIGPTLQAATDPPLVTIAIGTNVSDTGTPPGSEYLTRCRNVTANISSWLNAVPAATVKGLPPSCLYNVRRSETWKVPTLGEAQWNSLIRSLQTELARLSGFATIRVTPADASLSAAFRDDAGPTELALPGTGPVRVVPCLPTGRPIEVKGRAVGFKEASLTVVGGGDGAAAFELMLPSLRDPPPPPAPDAGPADAGGGGGGRSFWKEIRDGWAGLSAPGKLGAGLSAIAVCAALVGWVELQKRNRRQEREELLAVLAGIVDRAASPDGHANLERLVREAPFLEYRGWRLRFEAIERLVCRVELRVDGVFQPGGTGFLVGANMVMTNHHVVELLLEGTADAIQCRFDYVATPNDPSPEGTVVPASAEQPIRLHDKELDYALIALEREPTAAASTPRGWFRVTADSGVLRVRKGASILVVQHPSAEPLKLALGAVLETTKNRVRYDANTLPGSSGSPCLDATLSLVALHQLGDPRNPKRKLGEYNQGIPIFLIAAHCEKNGIKFERPPGGTF